MIEYTPDRKIQVSKGSTNNSSPISVFFVSNLESISNKLEAINEIIEAAMVRVKALSKKNNPE